MKPGKTLKTIDDAKAYIDEQMENVVDVEKGWAWIEGLITRTS